ncbi:MAG TPA: hypothetical protein VE132_12595 [Micromonosporaceae bacterium]|nr:hypothetical protein [Micromonosporaceae bacterium]
MAELSRELLFGAIVAYVVAMMCYAAEYVIGVSAPGGSMLPSRVRERELVGAAAGGGAGPAVDRSRDDGGIDGDGDSGRVADAAPISPVSSRTWPWPGLSNAATDDDRTGLGGDRGVRWLPLFGRLAVGITALGLLLHAAGLVTRGVAAGRVPWGNMYEFIIAVTLVCSIGWMILVLRRPTASRPRAYAQGRSGRPAAGG